MIAIEFLWNTRASASIAVRVFAGLSAASGAPANAADNINGQVLGAGAPIANSTVTGWAESVGAPKQLGQAHTGADGRFTFSAGATGNDLSLSRRQGRKYDGEQSEWRQFCDRAYDRAGKRAPLQGHR